MQIQASGGADRFDILARMRVLMISKACVVGAYQSKLEAIAAHPGVKLTVVVPPEWRDERGVTRLERAHLDGYRLAVEPIAFNGNFHLHVYPGLRRRFEEARPEIVHLDEEPYNLSTWHAARLAQRFDARVVFFSWQNLHRRYPPPFSWMESDVLRRADAAIAGSAAAADVWRAKGYRGPITVLPQFGVDSEYFSPLARTADNAGEFVIGYAGRLVPEKGVDMLLRATARLPERVRVRVVGAGPERDALQRLAGGLGFGDRVSFEPMVPSVRMPDIYRGLDVLVLPSRTRSNWKEQFGRVLIEAMACGVPVVGSTCGEIPWVIGEAGLVFPEGDTEALARHLQNLVESPETRARLGRLGRARVLEHFTQQHVADETVQVYRTVMASRGDSRNG